ncbi:MAG: hypothetical protein U1D30_26550, partial [Planctomycetota bacterium]
RDKTMLGNHRNHALWTFVALWMAYLSNGGLTPAPDSAPNMQLALSLLHDGDMTFTPEEAPLLFHWQIRVDSQTRDVDLATFDHGMAALMAQGKLEVKEGRYLVVPSVYPGTYVSTFPMGTALVALPFLGIVEPFTGDLRAQSATLWISAKVFSAACVAAAAVFLFLTNCRFTSSGLALLLTWAFGLGTAVWTTSSQGLWQHGPTELFLSAAFYFMTDPRHVARNAALTGFCLGAATLCRPTSGLFVVAVGLYFLWTCRPALLLFITAGLPFAIALFSYNASLLGNPWVFGETNVVGHALEKTGNASMFATPLWTGASVALFSPSRGLFVFSPFLAFSFLAVPRIWREATLKRLRPWTVGVLGVWLVQFVYFDYWGGWTFGNRTLVDTTPMLALFLSTVIADLWQFRGARMLFLACVAWSVMIQAMGAFIYDTAGWNNRRAFEVQAAGADRPMRFFDEHQAKLQREQGAQVTELFLDIDKPENRDRLWSIPDSQILYYLTRLGESRRRRAEFADFFTRSRSTILADDYVRMANGFWELRDPITARTCLKRALESSPENPAADQLLRQWELSNDSTDEP